MKQSLSKHEDLEFFEDKIEKGLVAQIVCPSSPWTFADFWSHWPIGSKVMQETVAISQAHQEIGKPAG